MRWWLRTYVRVDTALAEDPVIDLRTHTAGLTTTCNVSSRGIRCSFRALQAEEGVGKGAITIYRSVVRVNPQWKPECPMKDMHTQAPQSPCPGDSAESLTALRSHQVLFRGQAAPPCLHL